MKNLIQNLKENNQDHEFYPTTKEIIQRLYQEINKDNYRDNPTSILEIGAGNGKVLKTLEQLSKEQNNNEKVAYFQNKYAIEKSEILIQQLPADVVIVGTDFWQQTLIDKKVDVVFCNPPYSEFEEWAIKIIKEAFAKTIYLVIPQRWERNKDILEAIKKREASFEILGSYDFLEADRQARAKVHLLKIDLRRKSGGYQDRDGTDPFKLWFEEEFKIKLVEVDL